MTELGLKHSQFLVDRKEGWAGTGDWSLFSLPLDTVYSAAARWKEQLGDVEKPWLCWNINDRWCVLQQKMLLEVGWTPVIGSDPRVNSCTVLPGAVRIDFNEQFGFPIMWPHFPLEFTFLFAPRLAFWHSDLLCRIEKLRTIAQMFERLRDGEIAAVLSKGGIRNLVNFKNHRYWELISCITKAASEDQFRRGAGWWRNFALHPSCTDAGERARPQQYNYDSGVGILYWKNEYNGRVTNISERFVKEGHCTAINRQNYRYLGGDNVHRPVGDELDANYDLAQVAQRLGLSHLL